MKTEKAGDALRPGWPKGKYCIYKKGSCPAGLKSGYITWDDEDLFNKNNRGGVLPDGVYDKDTKICYCCRTDGNKAEPIELPTSKPFFLVAYESPACQQVKWAIASTEWIRYDTEEEDDGYGGAYPYGAGLDDHTIHYCYYTSCNYTLTASRGSFQSPNYPNPYPAGQYCSWRIKVPEGLQVLLKFPKFTLQKGTSTDNIQLYDGQSENAPSLGVYAGDKVPPPSGVQSSSNELFVIFKSDSKNNLSGFQASYAAQKPTQPPSTVKTTSTVRSTKATTTLIKTTTKAITSPSTTRQRSPAKTTRKTSSTNKSSPTTVPTTTAQTTHAQSTTQKTQTLTTAQSTHAPTTGRTTHARTTARTTQAAATNKTSTSNAVTVNKTTVRPTRGTAASTCTTGKIKGTESTSKHFTTQRVTTKSTVSTTNAQTRSHSVPSTPEWTKYPSNRPTSEGIKETTPVVDTGSSGTSKTEPTNEPTDATPTENGPSTLESTKSESSLGYRKMEPENGSPNVALVLVPMLCLLVLGVCLLMLFLYRRRNHKRKNDPDCKQFVYYKSNPKTESVDSPLYESAVKFSDEGGEYAVNPLYGSKREIQDFYEKQNASEPGISRESCDLREYENPMYDCVKTPDESFA